VRDRESALIDRLHPADRYLLRYQCNVQIRASASDHGCGCDCGLGLLENASASAHETVS
jgi:hypothetical protein